MNSKQGYINRNVMKASGRLCKRMGLTLILFLVLFGAARDYLLVPLLGKLWGLVLKTTPEGFVSNANLVNSILKSPWIIPAGAAFIIVYALISLWQTSAIITGVGYAHSGKKIKLLDLIKTSFQRLMPGADKSNRMLLVYALIIVPFANVYQTNDVIHSIVIPEYIQDFINGKLILFVPFIILAAIVIYIALRWFFLLPAFILKKKNFKEAREESVALTEGCWLKNGVNITIYSLIEFVRRSLVPILIILVPLWICYLSTRELEFAARLFGIVGIGIGLEAVKCITGTLVRISVICYMVELYFEKLREKGMGEELTLSPQEPVSEPEQKNAGKLTLNTLQVICSVVFSIVIVGIYMGTVKLAQTDPDVILELFGRTEVIAHKGYSSRAPENTMPAFELADQCDPVSYIELDVWTSKDGIPVVLHNSNIEEATGIDRDICDCTAAELKTIPAPYSMDQAAFPKACIPTLEEVIAKYAGSTPLLIEIKGFKVDPQLPARIVELMKQYDCEYTSLIHSGDYGALEAVKRIDPDIRCGLILAMATGNYYDLPYADFFSIEHTFVDQSVVAQLHRRGKGVFVWTVNYPESVEAIRFTGADGIITDVPDEINGYYSDANDLITEAVFKKLENLFNRSSAENAVLNFENGEY